MKDPNDPIGNRHRDLLACNAMPVLTAPPRAPYSMRTGGYLPSVKGQGPEGDHSSRSSIVVKKHWNYTSTPNICLHGLYREKSTFLTSSELRSLRLHGVTTHKTEIFGV